MEIELLKDKNFKNGFIVSTIDGTLARMKGSVFNYFEHISPGNLTYGNSNARPDWFIAQWWNKKSIYDGEKVYDNDIFTVFDGDKKLSCNTKTGSLYMEIDAESYYAKRHRLAGEAWPHLLVEQKYENGVKLADLKKLTYSIDFTIDVLEDFMQGAENKDLHSAQFQWVTSVNNFNKNSKGCNDYFWFNMPLFDKRYDITPEFKAQDTGKDDCTFKYIYCISNSEYMKGGAKKGKRVKVEYNALPQLMLAYNEAKQKGYLKDCTLDDMVVGTINLGFEMSGTYKIGATIHSLSLLGEV